jgi:hypothetical protein
MTHDELLEVINVYNDGKGDSFANALRAVMELHKPWNFGCSHCINIEGGYMPYPCPTIQAIERELN